MTGSTTSFTSTSTSTAVSSSTTATVPVAIQENGLGTDASGVVLTVDGNSYTEAQLPQTINWVVGSQHTLTATANIVGSTGVLYSFQSWSNGGPQSQSIVAPNTPVTYTAAYQRQLQIVIQESGLGYDTFGPAVNVDGTTYTAAQFPLYFYWAPGSSHSIYAYTSLPGTGGNQYNFQSWSDAGAQYQTILVSTPASYIAYYGTTSEQTVSITIDAIPEVTGVIYVDGNMINAPQTFYWQIGSSHTLSVLGGPYDYGFQYWQLDGNIYTYSQTFNYVVDGSHTLAAVFNGAGQGNVAVTLTSSPFTGSYLIQVDGGLVNTPYTFYWSVGSIHTISATGVANGYTFQYWALDGNEYSTSLTFTYQVDGPHTFVSVFSYQTVPEFPNATTIVIASFAAAGASMILSNHLRTRRDYCGNSIQ
jgi:hypothetical protein